MKLNIFRKLGRKESLKEELRMFVDLLLFNQLNGKVSQSLQGPGEGRGSLEPLWFISVSSC